MSPSWAVLNGSAAWHSSSRSFWWRSRPSGDEADLRWISGARRTIGVMAAEQALHFGHGRRSAGRRCAHAGCAEQSSLTTLAGPWAQPTQPLPITPQDDPEGEPIGTMQGSLEDMQGRFNLNNCQAAWARRSMASRKDPLAAGAIPASANLGRRSNPNGRDGARLDRCKTTCRAVRTARRTRSIPRRRRPTAPATGP
jgi:hypothetical protein